MNALYRTSAFFTTWSAEILRQPAMMAALVVGPFLILLAFGQSVDVTRIEPRVIVVQPSEDGKELQPLPEELEDYVEIVAVTEDLAWARSELREGKVDGVAVIPHDPQASLEKGEHVPLQILTSDIDPFRLRLAEAYLNEQVAVLNQRTLANIFGDAQDSFREVRGYIGTAREYIQTAIEARSTIEDSRETIQNINRLMSPIMEVSDALAGAAESMPLLLRGFGIPQQDVRDFRTSMDNLARMVDTLNRELDGSGEPTLPTEAELRQMDADLAQIEETGELLVDVPPEVLSAPFVLDFQSIAPFNPTFAAFYAPAVLALLIQHLGISLAALSATRLRERGLLDMLRISPARPIEVANGNFLAFGLLLLAAGAVLIALLMLTLNVPIHGSYLLVALTVLLLVAVSLGIGFVIAMIASSEKHAAQLAMLILLASVFFSGFVLSLDRIGWPVRAISYALPSTYAMRSLQDVMLRGVLWTPWDLVVLGLAAGVFYALTVLLLRRRFNAA